MDVLLSRLTWPSSIVRERACRAIAGLMKDNDCAPVVKQSLLAWIREQELESVACIGLLCFVRAKLDKNEAAIPTRGAIEQAMSNPSELSHMLIDELSSSKGRVQDSSNLHSGAAPKDFRAPPFFEHNMTRFLPPIYQDVSGDISGFEGISFVQQWGYEWTGLAARAGIPLTTEPLSFSGWSDRHHYVAIDFLLSEVYRSAFLRALAWAAERGAVDGPELRHLCTLTLPVDLGLWSLESVSVPKWWPKPSEPQGELDTVPAQAWQTLSELYHQNIECKEDWVIAYASGRVHEGQNIYDLTIRGCFQKCVGPRVPDLEEICVWYDENAQDWQAAAEFWFRGILQHQSIQDLGIRLSDWELLPSAATVLPRSFPRWQHWRVQRGIYLPSVFLGGDENSFYPAGQELLIQDEKGVWAKWCDWPYRLREMVDANLSLSCGQHLLVDRKRIDAFSEANHAVFCWICELVGYSRKHGYGEFDVLSDYQVFGASAVCRS